MNKFIIGLLLASSVAMASYVIPNHGVTMSKHLAGEAFMWGGSSCPAGSIAMDGSSQLRAGTYANLFAIVGTTYGAADGTHFNVPNAQGVYIRGSGTQTISAITYTGTRGTSQSDRFASHRHSLWGSTGGTVGVLAAANTGAVGGIVGVVSGQQYVDIMTGSSHQTMSDTGTGTETTPANIVMLYCMVY